MQSALCETYVEVRTKSKFEDVILLYMAIDLPLFSIATHFKPGFIPSCIDNILTNSTDLIIKSGVCKNVSNHHCPIFCLTSAKWNPCESESIIPKYDYKETNMIKFENAFSTYLYNKNYLDKVDLNEANFNDLVTNINMDESMVQSKRNRINNPWIIFGIIASIAKKYHL